MKRWESAREVKSLEGALSETHLDQDVQVVGRVVLHLGHVDVAEDVERQKRDQACRREFQSGRVCGSLSRPGSWVGLMPRFIVYTGTNARTCNAEHGWR